MADHPYLTRSKTLSLPQRSWVVQGKAITMSDPAASISTGSENIVVSSDPSETSEHSTTIQHDEQIARLTQESEDLRGELNRVRNMTNSSFTLQSPPPQPKNVAPNPPRLPSLESPVPERSSPRNNAPTNNNFPSITPTNPPPVNLPDQSLGNTPYIPLPTNTNPPPTTTLLNPPHRAITYYNYPQQPFYPYHYTELYQAPLTPYPVYNTQANCY